MIFHNKKYICVEAQEKLGKNMNIWDINYMPGSVQNITDTEINKLES